MFACEGWIVGDLEAKEFDNPSQLFIEAIEDSEIIIFKEANLSDITNLVEAKKKIKLLSRRIAVLQKRVIMLMSATALERYQHFLKMYPELSNRVPQKMIASYLGITPEALSTIKRKLFKEQQNS